MKKIVYFCIIAVFIMLISCSVNENTGLIVISNLTMSDISPVKVGNTYLVSYLKRGAKYDYWFYSTLSGKLSGGSVVQVILYDDGETVETRDERDMEFKVGYEYKIDIVEKDDKNWFYVYEGEKSGGGSDDPTK